jgi:SMC interacting uncharacterized protein involved in chromosome segregation
MKYFSTVLSLLLMVLFLSSSTAFAQQDDRDTTDRLQMKKLRERLADIRIKLKSDVDDIKIQFNAQDIHDQIADAMVTLKETMGDLKFNWEGEHFDNEKFQEELAQAMEHLKFEMDTVINVEINLEGLEESLENLEVELEGLDEELEKVSDQISEVVEKYRLMREEMDQELYKDGYIESPDADYDIDIDKEEIRINGKKLSPEDEEKYRGIIEKYFENDTVWDYH